MIDNVQKFETVWFMEDLHQRLLQVTYQSLQKVSQDAIEHEEEIKKHLSYQSKTINKC